MLFVGRVSTILVLYFPSHSLLLSDLLTPSFLPPGVRFTASTTTAPTTAAWRRTRARAACASRTWTPTAPTASGWPPGPRAASASGARPSSSVSGRGGGCVCVVCLCLSDCLSVSVPASVFLCLSLPGHHKASSSGARPSS